MQRVQIFRGYVGDFGNRFQITAQITQVLIRAFQCVSTIAPLVRVLMDMPPATVHVAQGGRLVGIRSRRVVDDPCRVRSIAGHAIGCSIHDDRRLPGMPVKPLRIRLHVGWQCRGPFIGFEVGLP
ncbi:hypothetical protein D3C73_1269540 [compost metagenome]